MARERFVIADTHHSQPSMCAFPAPNGIDPLRPWGRPVPTWKSMSEEERADLMPEFIRRAAEMDEDMVQRWNAIVPATGATVYHLGDVAMKKKDLVILDRLHGKKKLIPGNHDILSYKDYAPYFYEIAGYRIGDGIIMSHIPIHEASMKATWTNVHGHLHADRVMVTKQIVKGGVKQLHLRDLMTNCVEIENVEVPDPRYLCVSVEHTGYAPLPWDEMMARIAAQKGAA